MGAMADCPKKAIEVTIRLGGHDEEDLRDRLRCLLTDWDLYGVRPTVDSHTGITEVVRNPGMTKARYNRELMDYVDSLHRLPPVA